jgi:hypothetical protein
MLRFLLVFSVSIVACAQQGMPPMDMQTHTHTHNFAGMYLMHMASGTSMNPLSWPMPMLMMHAGSWELMLMGQAFVADVQQTGPRGRDKFYSTNWFMTSAIHRAGRGSFMVQLMLSLEPLTVTDRRYPELFQTGETAYGRPIVDGQHPHNLIMGIGLQYARPVGDNILQFYVAPVGDPALGPVAFPHRASALELPQAPLGHHWQDSTHIADDVVTAAIKRDRFRFEASGFHGAEPNENRWTIAQGAIDSYSARASVFPSKNWMAQVSAGRISHPEQQQPGDVIRATASVHYTRPMANDQAWSSSLIWGRNHDTATQHNLNSVLAETLLPIHRGNFVTGRFELVDKDELLPSGAIYRVGAYTAGFTHDVAHFFNALETGIGANVTAYTIPAALKPVYGDHPFAATVYLRVRLNPNQ